MATFITDSCSTYTPKEWVSKLSGSALLVAGVALIVIGSLGMISYHAGVVNAFVAIPDVITVALLPIGLASIVGGSLLVWYRKEVPLEEDPPPVQQQSDLLESVEEAEEETTSSSSEESSGSSKSSKEQKLPSTKVVKKRAPIPPPKPLRLQTSKASNKEDTNPLSKIAPPTPSTARKSDLYTLPPAPKHALPNRLFFTDNDFIKDCPDNPKEKFDVEKPLNFTTLYKQLDVQKQNEGCVNKKNYCCNPGKQNKEEFPYKENALRIKKEGKSPHINAALIDKNIILMEEMNFKRGDEYFWNILFDSGNKYIVRINKADTRIIPQTEVIGKGRNQIQKEYSKKPGENQDHLFTLKREKETQEIHVFDIEFDLNDKAKTFERLDKIIGTYLERDKKFVIVDGKGTGSGGTFAILYAIKEITQYVTENKPYKFSLGGLVSNARKFLHKDVVASPQELELIYEYILHLSPRPEAQSAKKKRRIGRRKKGG